MSRELVVRPVGEFPHGRWIADCGLADDAEQVANATLIAAAPDMAEALAKLVALYDDDEGCSSLPEVIAARAALQKAGAL